MKIPIGSGEPKLQRTLQWFNSRILFCLFQSYDFIYSFVFSLFLGVQNSYLSFASMRAPSFNSFIFPSLLNFGVRLDTFKCVVSHVLYLLFTIVNKGD